MAAVTQTMKVCSCRGPKWSNLGRGIWEYPNAPPTNHSIGRSGHPDTGCLLLLPEALPDLSSIDSVGQGNGLESVMQ